MARFDRRDELIKYLIKNGIEAKIHYPVPLHLQNAAKNLGYKEGDFPVSEKYCKEILTLPVHQYITSDQIDYMIQKIYYFFGS